MTLAVPQNTSRSTPVQLEKKKKKKSSQYVYMGVHLDSLMNFAWKLPPFMAKHYTCTSPRPQRTLFLVQEEVVEPMGGDMGSCQPGFASLSFLSFFFIS